MIETCIDHDIEQAHQVEIDQLQAQIARRLNGRLRNLQLLVRGHGLVLRGRAPSYYVKQLVQHEVMAATSLPILANEIEVA